MTTYLLVYLLLAKARPAPPAYHPIACSNPVKCHVARGVIRQDPRDKPRR